MPTPAPAKPAAAKPIPNSAADEASITACSFLLATRAVSACRRRALTARVARRKEQAVMDASSAALLGMGLAAAGFAGAGVGIGYIFGKMIEAVARSEERRVGNKVR